MLHGLRLHKSSILEANFTYLPFWPRCVPGVTTVDQWDALVELRKEASIPISTIMYRIGGDKAFSHPNTVEHFDDIHDLLCMCDVPDALMPRIGDVKLEIEEQEKKAGYPGLGEAGRNSWGKFENIFTGTINE